MKKMFTICLCVIVCFAILVGGCTTGVTNDPQTDTTLLGTGIGALAGQAIGGDTKGTLIGAGIGALSGWFAGGALEQQRRTQDEISSMHGDINRVTVWITNSNGSKIGVDLRKDGYGGYIGPRGERYESMPSEEQLRMVYGF